MNELPLSRRTFLAASAASPVVIASDRIAQFVPPPERVRIVSAVASSVVPPPQYSAEEIRQIQSQGRDVKLTVPANADQLKAALTEADVVFGALSPEMFAQAKNLRWMQATEAGMERILFPELVKSDVVVTNMARMFAPAISESAMGMLLSLTRGYARTYVPQFHQHLWKPDRDLVEVDGLTMGVVGMGGLGSATAMRAHYGFNMRILAVEAKPMAKPIFVEELREPAWLMEMVPQVDVLVSAAPSTKETADLFNERVFRAMKKTAYFISISRGALVDETALIRALKEGWIAGAGLDVTKKEPLPGNDPLWECPNLMLTCHTSGYSPQRRVRLVGLLAENVRRYTSGLPLVNVVDKVRGY